MRRIGAVLAISLTVALLGVAAFTYGSQLAWVAVQPRVAATPATRLALHTLPFGALQVEAAPTAPTNLHATVNGSKIDLTWSAVTGADTYTIYRGTSSHGEGKTPYATGVFTLFFHNEKNIDPKTTYYYTITAVNRAGQESTASNEASASLTPAAPVTTPVVQRAKAAAPNLLPIFIILGLLLLAFGGLLLVRSRVRPSAANTGQLPALRDADGGFGPAASYSRAPTGAWRDASAASTVLGDSPYADAQGYPPSVGPAPVPPTLPANASASEGLLARYGGASPEEVIADSGPLRELMPDGTDDPWYRDTGALPGVRGTTGAQFRPIDDNPAWPMQRPRDYTDPTDGTDSRRTLLLVGAGASFVLGVMALFLFLFFNFFAASSTTPQTGGVAPQGTQGATTPAAQVSPTATTIPVPPTAIVSISSGGSGSGAFTADAEFSGGTPHTVQDHIDLSGALNPAPEAVYQSERWGEFTYHLGGFTPNGTYTVRLHFAETYFKSPGQRIFSVAINGQPVLTNFDIVALAGAPDKALIQSFTVTADGGGVITIDYHNGSQNNAKSSGIEVFPAG